MNSTEQRQPDSRLKRLREQLHSRRFERQVPEAHVGATGF
jgi:hypothetical protein